MGEALMSGGAGGSGTIYKWKRYELNSSTLYTWNKWNLGSTTTYKWNKYNCTASYVWNKYSAAQYMTYNTNPINKGEVGHFVASGYCGYVYTGYQLTKFGYKGTGDSITPNGNKCLMFNNSSNQYKYWIPEAYHYSGSPVLGVGSRADSHTWEASDGNRTEWHFWCNPYYQLTETGVYEWLKAQNPGNANPIDTVSGTNSSDYPDGGVKDYYWYELKSADYTKGSYIGVVTGSYSSAYPSNGVSGSYWYESAGSSVSYYRGSYIGTVSSSSSSAYPNGSWSGSYWYDGRSGGTTYSQGAAAGTVYNTNRNAYPDNFYTGSYWYVFDGEA